MANCRIRPVKAGKGMRMSYARQKEVLGMPNLIEIQKDSTSGSLMRDCGRSLRIFLPSQTSADT